MRSEARKNSEREKEREQNTRALQFIQINSSTPWLSKLLSHLPEWMIILCPMPASIITALHRTKKGVW